MTLVSHDSWAVSKDVLKDFEKRSGYKVRVLKDGDAGQAVNKAILTKDNPQGDVFFGVDNTPALPRPGQRAVPAVPGQGLGHGAASSSAPTRASTASRPSTPATSASNYDKAWFSARLADPRPGPSRTWRSPRTRTCSSPRTRPPPRRVSASCWAAPRVRRRRLAGLLEEAEGQRRQGGRRLGTGLLPGVLRVLGGQEGRRRPAARGVVRLLPARRGDLRQEAARHRPDRRGHRHLLPAGRVRRAAEQREEHQGRQGAPRLPC